MKKYILKLSYFTIVCLFVVSCKKDDPAPVNLLLGTWTETSEVISGCTDPLDNSTDTCTSACSTLVFTETTVSGDGSTETYTKTDTTLSIVSGSITFTVSYTVTGTTLVITQQDSADFGNCKTVTTYKKS